MAAHPLVGEARGYGLVGAVELVADKATKRSFDPKAGVGPRAAAFAEAEGLLLRFLAGDVLSICPPLVITPQEIDELFDRLARALDRTLDWATAASGLLQRPDATKGNGAGFRPAPLSDLQADRYASATTPDLSGAVLAIVRRRGCSPRGLRLSPCRGASTTTIAPIFTRL